MPVKRASTKKKTGVGRKTKAEKEGVKLEPRAVIVNRIVSLTFPSLTDGKKKMTIEEACEKMGITSQTFRNWRREDPGLEAIWEEAKACRHEVIKEYAKSNIEKAVRGEMKGIRPKEQVDISFRVLTSTDKDWQPRSQVEVKSVNLNFDMSMEELQRRAVDLANELGINNNAN